MKRLSILICLFLWSTIVRAQQPSVERLVSNEISVAAYDEAVHGRVFGLTNPLHKRTALVIGNVTDRAVMYTVVTWRWVRADGTPGRWTLTSSNFGHPFPIIGPHSSVAMLPETGVIAPGQQDIAPGQRGMGGMLKVPADMVTGTQMTVSLDAVILADGQVIGPNGDREVKELQARQRAIEQVRKIINDAHAQGRDPKLDIQHAIQTESDPIVKRHLTESSGGGQLTGAPQKLELPRFYRK